MRWMIFSDTHLGSRNSKRVADLTNLLKEKTKDIDLLIVNGDFLDFWRNKLNKIYCGDERMPLINFIFETLPAIGKKVVYILGNHEDISEEMDKFREEFPNIEMVWNYNVGKLKVIHGHQFDKSYTEDRDGLYRTTQIQKFFDNLFRFDVRAVLIKIDKILHFGVYDKFVKEIHDGVIEQYSEYFDGVVVSHSHYPSINKHGDFTVYDTGNTYSKLNYLIFEDEEPHEVKL